MTAATKKGAKSPSINVRARGRINAVLDQLGQLYKEKYPDRDCRWVYAPTHKPELSNVLGRRAQGYVEVKLGELEDAGDLMPGLGPDDVVRVADVVLMSIEAEVRDMFKEDLHEAAKEQGERVGRKYYEALMEEEAMGPGGTRHVAVGRGQASIEEREFEYEIEQRTSEEEG